MDCSPPDSSVHGLFQARILEWVAISSSRGSSRSRDQMSSSSPGRQINYLWATWEAHVLAWDLLEVDSKSRLIEHKQVSWKMIPETHQESGEWRCIGPTPQETNSTLLLNMNNLMREKTPVEENRGWSRSYRPQCKSDHNARVRVGSLVLFESKNVFQGIFE